MSKTFCFSINKNDFKMEVFRCGGKGGQKQNKTSSGVRLIHIPSGARGESREERMQSANKQKALDKLVQSPEFKKWLRVETARHTGGVRTAEQLDAEVDYQMQPKFLKIENL
jgi:protein subunit release factor A